MDKFECTIEKKECQNNTLKSKLNMSCFVTIFYCQLLFVTVCYYLLLNSYLIERCLKPRISRKLFCQNKWSLKVQRRTGLIFLGLNIIHTHRQDESAENYSEKTLKGQHCNSFNINRTNKVFLFNTKRTTNFFVQHLLIHRGIRYTSK